MGIQLLPEEVVSKIPVLVERIPLFCITLGGNEILTPYHCGQNAAQEDPLLWKETDLPQPSVVAGIWQ